MKEKNIKYLLWLLVIFKEIIRLIVEASLARWVFELIVLSLYFLGLCILLKKKSVLDNILYFIYFLHDICAPIYYTVYHLAENKFFIEGYVYVFYTISGVSFAIFLIVAIIKLLGSIRGRFRDTRGRC